jgi:hypothetical protein
MGALAISSRSSIMIGAAGRRNPLVLALVYFFASMVHAISKSTQ